MASCAEGVLMRTVSNSPLLEKYIADLGLNEIMNLDKVRPVICISEKGEILTAPHKVQQYLFFVVSGKVQVYGVDAEGRKIPVNLVSKGSVLGDVEFCRQDHSVMISEALTEVVCIGVSVPLYRKILEDDNRFLRFLLKSVSSKVYLTEAIDAPVISVEEKLLHYMEQECPDGLISGIEHASLRLRCSRRQLQRLLSSLCDEGHIIKIKKGSYQLADKVKTKGGSSKKHEQKHN